MASAKNFFKDYEKELIVSTIRKAEMETTGEIRIHVDDRCDGNAMDRAINVFQFLHIDKTQFKNGVLLYIAVKDKKFAVIGDEGINAKVDSNFWKSIASKLSQDFAQENYCKAMVESIEQIAVILKKHFPAIDNWTTNELIDEISFE